MQMSNSQTTPEAKAPGQVGPGRDGLLNPVERFSEILFGLIMVLSFTGSLGVATAGREEVRTMLIGAIGCNLAWGIVDGVMYIVQAMTMRNRDRLLYRSLKATSTPQAARSVLAHAVPPAVADALDDGDMERLRQRMAANAPEAPEALLRWRDFVAAFAVCVLVFLSTFPVVIPFIIVHHPATAIRVSNAVAIVMLFWAGWSLAKFSGGRAWAMGTAMVAIGVILVAMTIALGG